MFVRNEGFFENVQFLGQRDYPHGFPGAAYTLCRTRTISIALMDENDTLPIRRIPCDEAPTALLLEADPNEEKIRTYLPSSFCFAATEADEIVGIYVLKPLDQTTFELMNIAVQPAHQTKGIGSTMLRHAIATAKELGAHRLEVGTGSFGYQLAFYQRAGFRVFAIERDFFLRHYPEPLFEAGIQLKDMIRLAIDF